MDTITLTPQTLRFIADNRLSDPDRLRLKYAGRRLEGVDLDLAITQIECRRKARNKLPDAVACPEFIFPSVLAAEQCTSQVLAALHTELVPGCDNILDMTCGLGIDSMSMAKAGICVTACEIQTKYATAVRHNASVTGIDNLEVVNTDSIKYLSSLPSSVQFDLIFADPARRGEYNKRTFGFEQCTPDILASMQLIRQHTKALMIKASPMLDISYVLSAIPALTDIWILSVRNECKEIVTLSRFDKAKTEPAIHTINITTTGERQGVSFAAGKNSMPEILADNDPEPGMLLYEPDSSVMKIISRLSLTEKFPSLRKLDSNTNLYTSSVLLPDFPGRIFRIDDIISYNKKNTIRHKDESWNIISRNFPDPPGTIAKRLHIREGGPRFIIAATANARPRLFVSTKIQ